MAACPVSANGADRIFSDALHRRESDGAKRIVVANIISTTDILVQRKEVEQNAQRFCDLMEDGLLVCRPAVVSSMMTWQAGSLPAVDSLAGYLPHANALKFAI